MKYIALCLISLALLAPAGLFADAKAKTVPPPKKEDAFIAATLIVDGKEFKVLISKTGDREALAALAKESGLTPADKSVSKAARKAGWDIMTACVRGNFLLAEPSPSSK